MGSRSAEATKRSSGAGAKRFALMNTAWGTCAAVWRRAPGAGDVLCRILLPGVAAEKMRAIIRKEDEAEEASTEPRPEWWGELTQLLEGFFGEDPTAATAGMDDVWGRWAARLDLEQLTDFQRGVLKTTAEIRAGETATYGQVAERVGRAGAARAVGGALGANPWPVLIPCHRVVGSSGAMRGFSAPGGCQAKRRMIEWERGND